MSRVFNGSNQYLRNATPPVTATPLALCAWGYNTDGSQYDPAITINDGSTAALHTLAWNAQTSINARSVSSGSTADAASSAGPAVNTWNHGAGIWAATDDRRAFLNGGCKGTNATVRNTSGLSEVVLGCYITSSSFFTGRLAEVAVWDLSGWPGATDVLKADLFEDVALPLLAAGGSPLLVPKGLVAYWPLLASDRDRMGSFHLTPANSPTWGATHAPIWMPGGAIVVPGSAGAPPAGNTRRYTLPLLKVG